MDHDGPIFDGYHIIDIIYPTYDGVLRPPNHNQGKVGEYRPPGSRDPQPQIAAALSRPDPIAIRGGSRVC